MDARLDTDYGQTAHWRQRGFRVSPAALSRAKAAAETWQGLVSGKFLQQLAVVFLAYFIAGGRGQATTTRRSSNLGPVWPAYGIAVAAFLGYGYPVWPAILSSAFLIAAWGSVPLLGAFGQAAGATFAALSGAFLLRRMRDFDPCLSRLRDALGLV